VMYLRPDELHTAFNFDFLGRPWDARSLRTSIQTTLEAHAPMGAPATWVLSNHDVTRPVTRYGQQETSFSFAGKRPGVPTDLVLGRRRARAAALLTAALPGSLYIYQGDELGLEEVQDLPEHQLRDPMYFRSDGSDPGRDGCRVPLPWSGDVQPFGFSPQDATREPWLRQPDGWAAMAVSVQRDDPNSTLNLYRAALRIRRDEIALGSGPMRWLPSPDGVVAFARGAHFVSITNLSGSPFELPTDAHLLLASEELGGSSLPPDATAWLHIEQRWEATPSGRTEEAE
jgi:alpha-glucosidase